MSWIICGHYMTYRIRMNKYTRFSKLMLETKKQQHHEIVTDLVMIVSAAGILH